MTNARRGLAETFIDEQQIAADYCQIPMDEIGSYEGGGVWPERDKPVSGDALARVKFAILEGA